MIKQNIFDFLKEHQKEIAKQKPDSVFDPILQRHKSIYPGNYLTVILDPYREIALMRYPPRPIDQLLCEEGKEPERFEYVLLSRDFPWRNKIAWYVKDCDGKYIVKEWLDGKDSIPSPSLQRFLDSGEKRYVPKFVSRSSDVDVKKLLIHGKYHFGSSVNV